MQKSLVPNRGEMAIRTFRAANELELKTVAICSQEDRLSLNRFRAHEAYPIEAPRSAADALVGLFGLRRCSAPGSGSRGTSPTLELLLDGMLVL